MQGWLVVFLEEESMRYLQKHYGISITQLVLAVVFVACVLFAVAATPIY